MNLIELENQYTELLPARTLLQVAPIVGEAIGNLGSLLPGKSMIMDEAENPPAAPSDTGN